MAMCAQLYQLSSQKLSIHFQLCLKCSSTKQQIFKPLQSKYKIMDDFCYKRGSHTTKLTVSKDEWDDTGQECIVHTTAPLRSNNNSSLSHYGVTLKALDQSIFFF